MTIDLSQLPEPSIVEEPDFETINAARQSALVELVPSSLQEQVAQTIQIETEPLTILLEENAYRELLLRQRVNDAARATMLSHATGDDLDNVGARFNKTRLVVQEADDSATPAVEEILESDAAFRLRILGAFDELSVAGPAGAYEQFSRNASAKVSDVKVTSPTPCEVLVSILSTEGDGTADADLIAVVDAALSDEDVRPVGDRVTVQSAEIINYAIDATLFFYPGPEQDPLIAAAQEAAETYVSTQRRLGRDIRLSAIYAALHIAGVQRVVLNSPPADLVLSKRQAGYCTGITITSGGTDE